MKDKHKVVKGKHSGWKAVESESEAEPGNEEKAFINHLEVRIQRKKAKKENWMRRQSPAPDHLRQDDKEAGFSCGR